MPFSFLNILAFRAVALETLNSFAFFCKVQDSGVRVEICIFSLLFDILIFLSSVQQVYLFAF